MLNIRKKMDPNFTELHAEDDLAYEKISSEGVTLMGWADPFYPDPLIPEHIKNATKKAIDDGQGHYTIPIGSIKLRKIIAEKLRMYNGIIADPEKEIIITPGSDTGLYYAMRPFIDPKNNDEVLNPDPSYPNNFRNVRMMGAISVSIPLKESSDFQIDIGEFEKRVTKKTKLVVLTHPNNPTTTVYTKGNLQELAKFIVKNDLVLIIDQAFESTIFDNREFVSPATISGMWDRAVTVFSISKSMGLSGFRLGYLVANSDIMDVYYGGAVSFLGTTNTISQYGAIAAFKNDDFISNYNQIYDKRRHKAFKLLSSVPGVKCYLPESGFLMWVNISRLGTSDDVVSYLINEAKVAVNSGRYFGEYGEGFIRIVLASLKSEEQFDNSINRIAVSLTRLSKNRM